MPGLKSAQKAHPKIEFMFVNRGESAKGRLDTRHMGKLSAATLEDNANHLPNAP